MRYLRTRLSIDDFVTKGNQADDGSYVEQIDNLNSFEFMCEKYKTIDQLILYLDDMNKEFETNNSQKIKLLTIHKSKGMEYPVVFIVGCSDGLLPHYKNEDIDDECRLFYVAMTRAEKELYISFLNSYNNKDMFCSPFLESIQSSIKEISDTKEV